MRIITWNINSIRLRIETLSYLVATYQPDILSIQETKVTDELFPYEIIKKLGFQTIVYSGQKSYNGVALFAKKLAREYFSINLYNNDRRHIAIIVDDIVIHNFYVPSGGDIPDPTLNCKFEHKLQYLDLMRQFLIANYDQSSKIIITGDLNIAPHKHDVWSSKQLQYVVSHTDIERKKLYELQNSLSFIDSARYFVGDIQKCYTWWSYKNLDWQKSNKGRRLDHIWVSNNLEYLLKDIKTLQEFRSIPQPSDHIPFVLDMNY